MVKTQKTLKTNIVLIWCSLTLSILTFFLFPFLLVLLNFSYGYYNNYSFDYSLMWVLIVILIVSFLSFVTLNIIILINYIKIHGDIPSLPYPIQIKVKSACVLFYICFGDSFFAIIPLIGLIILLPLLGVYIALIVMTYKAKNIIRLYQNQPHNPQEGAFANSSYHHPCPTCQYFHQHYNRPYPYSAQSHNHDIIPPQSSTYLTPEPDSKSFQGDNLDQTPKNPPSN